MTNADNAERWFDRVGRGEDPGRRTSGNVCYWGAEALYSYGRHFPLAVPLRHDGGGVRLWLLNGDRVSTTTSGHQSMVRGLAERSAIPSMIVPFSALASAGIRDLDTVEPLEIAPDWFTTETYRCEVGGCPRRGCDGGEEHERQVHHLGASVFDATALEDGGGRPTRFLSAFDEQEGAGLYFLAQLPAWATDATTYAGALQALRPVEVVKADAMGLQVTRQGDLFGIPDETLTKRELRAQGAEFVRGLTRGMLNTAHTATEVAFLEDGERVYARGCFYHRPGLVGRWGRGDHARRKIGDGRTWHRIVRNNVPTGRAFTPRAWSMGGGVD